MVWPGEHVMAYGMAMRASHGVWYGQAGLTWYIEWPSRHNMVLWYGLAWDMVCPCGHRMV